MGNIKIQESKLQLTNGRIGKIAVLIYVGDKDPILELDNAVSQYVGNELHSQYIDINMDNPWYRIIIDGINEMEQVNYDPKIHGIKK